MDPKRSLWIAPSLADDARRRAAEDRRSAGYRIQTAVEADRRPATQRGWMTRLLHPATRRPNPTA